MERSRNGHPTGASCQSEQRRATAPDTAARRLRQLLARPGPVRLVGVHDALGALRAEQAGFDAVWARAAVGTACAAPGPHFLHVRTRPGAPSGLGRISLDPAVGAARFARYLRSDRARSGERA
jgi:hypothetical protein